MQRDGPTGAPTAKEWFTPRKSQHTQRYTGQQAKAPTKARSSLTHSYTATSASRPRAQRSHIVCYRCIWQLVKSPAAGVQCVLAGEPRALLTKPAGWGSSA